MSDQMSAFSKPGGRFSLTLIITSVIALAACIYMYVHLGADEAGKIIPAPRLRAASSISDILATIITISGVTAPLVVAYLLVRERELQYFFIESIRESLSYHGCDLVVSRFAYLALCESAITLNPSVDLKTIHFLSTLVTDEEVSSASKDALKAVIVDPRLRQKYYECFSEDQDKDWLKVCVTLIGIFATFCFIDLYLRVFVDFGWFADLSELFLIVMTIGSNIGAYVLVLDFVTTKGAIKRQSSALIKNCCLRAAPEIFRGRREAEKSRENLSEQLKDMMHALRGSAN